jgi:putative tryptophan/tyrosine transport system substrate-binding protein
MIGRREFLVFAGGGAAWPIVARAQQEQFRRMGVLIGVADDVEGKARLSAFRSGMRELGWFEDRNIHLDIRFAAGDDELARTFAKELVGSAPDVILGNGGGVVTALQRETKIIPIVFAQVVDPVNSGFVNSLAHPGGNITGFVSFDYGMGAKWLEILKQILPSLNRVGVVRDPSTVGSAGMLGAIQAVASTFGVELIPLNNSVAANIAQQIDAFSREGSAGLIVVSNPTATVHREQIISLAAKYHLPAIYPYQYFPKSGGLISYGVDNLDLWRRSAGYVDRILKGEKPNDLPVQQPTKFDLVINMKTATALGVTVPPSLLATADEVIE